MFPGAGPRCIASDNRMPFQYHPPMWVRAARIVVGSAFSVVALMGTTISPAMSAPSDTGRAQISAVVNGRNLDDVDNNRPLELAPNKPVQLTVTVHNPGPKDLLVKSVRLDGRVMGLTFFSFDTEVDLPVPAGGSGDRNFNLDLVGL